MKTRWIFFAWLLTAMPLASMADEVPFKIVSNLFDANYKETMGLDYAPGAETVTVFAAAANTSSKTCAG